MRLALTSAACIGLVLLLAFVGKPGSRTFEANVELWYALWGVGVVLALRGVGRAVLDARPSLRVRLVVGAVSAGTLGMTALLVWSILELLSHVR